MSDETSPLEADAPAKPRGRRKLILIVALVLGLGVGGVGAAMFLGGSDDEAAAEQASEPPQEGAVLNVATLTSNVRGDANLARVGLAVVTSEGVAQEQVVERFPLVQDAAVSELARMPAEELRTAEGADALRRRLTRRAKRIYPDGEVLRVLLTELVVQ